MMLAPFYGALAIRPPEREVRPVRELRMISRLHPIDQATAEEWGVMKKAALILGILGGLIAGGLGMKWLSDIGAMTDAQRQMAQAMGQGDQLQSMGIAGILLLGSLAAGIVGGILVVRGRVLVGGIVMLAGGVVPLLYASQAIIFTAVLIAGGVVALVAHRNESRAAAA
jgi:hypothetical protein